MPQGVHTTVEIMAQQLLTRWVPKWYEAFTDGAKGGFHERVGHSFKPVYAGHRRLLTQCRQLAIYAHALNNGCQRHLVPGLDDRFRFIAETFHNQQTGGWHFSVDDSGRLKDKSYDLYTHAFVIFSLAHYYNYSRNDAAKTLLLRAVQFIEAHFRIKGKPGFAEALGEDLTPAPRPRRHESHMHLLEACLFAAEIFEGDDKAVFCGCADEIVSLFEDHFYRRDDNVLSEYFTDDLEPAPSSGHIICEPGHYYEWIWLLKKHAAAGGKPGRHDEICHALLAWANTHGFDSEYGGIFDELDEKGEVVADTKRIWPFAEGLKANALMLDSDFDRDEIKARISDLVDVFRRYYMQERGFWTEWFARDFTPATDYMPGTTPYHVYFGIMEARDVVCARGETKSWRAGVYMSAYRLRRKLSDMVRTARKGLSAER